MQLAHNNRVLAPEVDTVFFMTAVEHGFVSSSLVKEIASFGGDVSTMVPAAVRERLAAADRVR
jgi:pantetheine-phosphate adenylyltransferase